METFDNDIEIIKAAFGVELARAAVTRPDMSAFNVAVSLGLPTAMSLVASKEWTRDPITIDAREREAEVYRPAVPTKEEIAAKILAVTEERDTEARDKIAALRLVAEMYEYIPKAPSTQVNNNVMNGDVVRNVIAIPETADNWREDLRKSQRELVGSAGA